MTARIWKIDLDGTRKIVFTGPQRQAEHRLLDLRHAYSHELQKIGKSVWEANKIAINNLILEFDQQPKGAA